MARVGSRKPPAVEQVHSSLLNLIRDGGLLPGDRLPSEERLTERLNCSRPTLREAMKVLEQDGVLETQHGRGRFLTAGAALKVERPITCFESVSTMMRGLGYRPATRLLGIARMEAGPLVAAALGCGPHEEVVRVERLRFHERTALVYSLNFLREADLPREPALVEWTGSVIEILRGTGKEPVMSTAAVSAVPLPKEAARRHGLLEFGPALLITETCFTSRGEAVLFAEDYHRGDAFSFSFARR